MVTGRVRTSCLSIRRETMVMGSSGAHVVISAVMISPAVSPVARSFQ